MFESGDTEAAFMSVNRQWILYFWKDNDNPKVSEIPGTLIQKHEGFVFEAGPIKKLEIHPRILGVKFGEWVFVSSITYQQAGQAGHTNF